jgi:hypothetical protein
MMLPIGPNRRPEPAEDINYWYPRYQRYAQELEVDRIQSRKAFIWTLRAERGSREQIEDVEYELTHPVELRMTQTKAAFAEWWLSLKPTLRAHLMGKYEIGLQAVLEQHAETTQAAIQKYMRKQREE